MTIKQYQYILSIPTGITYELDVAKYLGLDTTLSSSMVMKLINEELTVKETILKNTIQFNNKEWIIEKEILDSTFEQWIQLELVLSEQDNVANLHKLLAIYLRPKIKQHFYSKSRIEPFIIDKQEGYANELLDLPLNVAQSLVLFFYQNVPKFMNNIKIQYLNLMNQEINSIIKKK